jgi:hypothetical protein
VPVAGQQAEHAAAPQVPAQQAFQGRVHVQQRIVQPVCQPGGLRGQVGVVAGQHTELDGGLLVRPDPAKGVRQGARGIGDNVRVAGVGLGFPRIQVRDPPHRQPGQISHSDPPRARHRDRQRPDRGELVHDHQHPPVPLEVLEQSDQIGLGVGKWTIDESVPVIVQGDGVMGLAGHIDAAEHLELTAGWCLGVACRRQLKIPLWSPADQPRTQAPAATLREGIQSRGHVPISGHTRPATPVTAPLRSSTTGAISHAGIAGLHPQSEGPKKVTGAEMTQGSPGVRTYSCGRRAGVSAVRASVS